MKSIISKTCMLVAVATMLVSFVPNFGGEGFEISLNGKVLVQQYGKNMDIVKTLSLEGASPNDLLTVRYHHCGKIGKNRVISIKDAQGKLVKEWRFKDVAEPVGEMSCKVQDLISLKKGNEAVLKLYYASTELPNGRQLAAVSFAGKPDHASIQK
jgi:hypothetical protein